MQKLLTGKKRLPGFNIPWKKIKLGEMGNTYNGLSGKIKMILNKETQNSSHTSTFFQMKK